MRQTRGKTRKSLFTRLRVVREADRGRDNPSTRLLSADRAPSLGRLGPTLTPIKVGATNSGFDDMAGCVLEIVDQTGVDEWQGTHRGSIFMIVCWGAGYGSDSDPSSTT